MRTLLGSKGGFLLVTGAVIALAPTTAFVAVGSQCQTRRSPPTRSSSALAFFNFGGNKQEKSNEPETSSETQNTNEEEPDLAEKIFTTFFGKPEEEPFGLKRFNSQRFPEQYPATTTDFDVAPVESDNPEMAGLRPLLKNTNLETRGLRLTFDANKNGWDATKFHQAVDKQGPALVVCQTRQGLMCGGYNPKGWVGYGEARGSIAAFLFVAKNDNEWIKLPKVGGGSLAIMDTESGPRFGADALVIPLSRDNPKTARSKLGSYYERMADGGNSLFGKDAQVQLKSLKVYHGVYGPDEYVPFTDAEPFALY